jgi:hypothetical protein
VIVTSACGRSTAKEVLISLLRRVNAGNKPLRSASNDPGNALPEWAGDRHRQHDIRVAVGAGVEDGERIKGHFVIALAAVVAGAGREREGRTVLDLLLQHQPRGGSQPPALPAPLPRRLHQGVAMQAEDLSSLQAGTPPHRLILCPSDAHIYMSGALSMEGNRHNYNI